MNRWFNLLLLAGLFALIGCQGLPAYSESFNGPWVVDMLASEAVNPDLAHDEYMRETVSQLTLSVDMEQHELIIQHSNNKDKVKRLPFTIIEQTKSVMVIDIDKSYTVSKFKLELKAGTLIFAEFDSDVGSDNFIFVPAQ